MSATLFMRSGAITAFVFISLDFIVSLWLGPATWLTSRVILEALPAGVVVGICYRLVSYGWMKTRRRPELDLQIRGKRSPCTSQIGMCADEQACITRPIDSKESNSKITHTSQSTVDSYA